MWFLEVGSVGTAGVGDYLLFFAACLVGAFGGIFVKEYDKRTEKIQNSTSSFNLLLSICSIVYYLILGLIATGGHFVYNGDTAWYAVFRSVGTVTGYIGYLQAVKYGPLFLSSIISRMGLLIPIVGSWILYGDALSVWKIIGAVLLFAALALFNGKGEGGTQKTTPRFWFYVMLSFTGNGVEAFALKIQQTEQQEAYLNEFLFYSSLIVAVAFFVIFFLALPSREGDTVPEEKKSKCKYYFALCMVGAVWVVLYTLGNSLYTWLSSGIVNQFPPVFFYMAPTGIDILFVFLISRFLYHEKFTLKQYIGCLAATAGLILVNF